MGPGNKDSHTRSMYSQSYECNGRLLQINCLKMETPILYQESASSCYLHNYAIVLLGQVFHNIFIFLFYDQCKRIATVIATL